MNLRQGIIEALLANADLLALVSDRISAGFAPGNTPVDAVWIVMTKISGNEEGAHDGNGNLTHPIFQFTIGGNDKEKVDEVQRLLVALHCTEFTFDGSVLTFMFSDERDAIWEQGVRVSEASVDLEVWANT